LIVDIVAEKMAHLISLILGYNGRHALRLMETDGWSNWIGFFLTFRPPLNWDCGLVEK
jgi:hypothetical protein